MRKKYIFGKKLYISVLTSILVLLTTVATTFAWVGVFANSTFESFDIDIKLSNLEEYGLEISLTGEEGTFSDTISSEEIKKAILKNWGYDDSIIQDDTYEALFNSLNMDQCTTVPYISDDKIIRLGNFKDMEGNFTKKYFKFDIYISATRFYEKGTTSDFKLDVFLNQGLITGNVRNKLLTNPFIYPNDYISPLFENSYPNFITPISGSTKISNASVDSKSVCRVAFEKFPVVDKYHPENYFDILPQRTIIYTGDSYDYPTYNCNEDIYEFGGILPDELNLSIGYYNSTEWWYAHSGIKTISISDPHADVYGADVYSTRGVGKKTSDIILSSSTNHLIDSSKSEEQISINQMMKMTVSFWIEGWDADCFNAIGNSPVTLAISMSITNEDEF